MKRPATQRVTGRQLTVIIVAVSAAVIATPMVALAATGTFSSASARTPAVSAKNGSSGSGAKAVYGNAAASRGSVYGVYGHTNSAHGYGVYSAGRLGSSGELVCAQCVTGADVNASTFPTVPDAGKLGGHTPSYYARIIPLSAVLPLDTTDHLLADVDGLRVFGECGSHFVNIAVRTDSTADDGTINFFFVSGTSAQSGGTPLTTTRVQLASAFSSIQTEGSAVYRRGASGRIVTINFHLFGDGCELFGDALTAA